MEGKENRRNDLKPCPFCGAAAFVWRTKYDVYIECSKYDTTCHRIMITGPDEETAARRWNRREDKA